MDNIIYVNSGYAGSKGVLSGTVLHREQWIGLSGAPRTTSVSVHTPLKYESIGVGLTVVNDQIGPLNQTLVYGDFSYTLKFKNKHKLSFGLKGGLNFLNARTSELSTTVANDASLLTNAQSSINPNFGTGIFYHTDKWYVGISSPKLFETKDKDLDINTEKRHYFLIAGYVFNSGRYWKLRPTVQFKNTVGAPFSLDVSLTGIYSDKLYLGAMHRWNEGLGAFVQFQVNPQFKAGLAYDFALTQLNRHNIGSLEALLNYELNFKDKGVRSPRYF